jgi:hypothetical protein
MSYTNQKSSRPFGVVVKSDEKPLRSRPTVLRVDENGILLSGATVELNCVNCQAPNQSS